MQQNCAVTICVPLVTYFPELYYKLDGIYYSIINFLPYYLPHLFYSTPVAYHVSDMWYMYVLILPLVKAVPLDDECYKSSVESFEGITVDDYGYFHQVVLKCLGKDANVEVSDFMNCVISHNKCNVDWHSLVNWRYCVCDTFLNAVSDCVTKWIIDGHIGDLDVRIYPLSA